MMSLLDRPPRENVFVSDSALGDAVGGTFAEVFYGRIQALADNLGGSDRVPAILGFAMAHEIGHLLLGPNCHSPSGIMRGRWDRWTVEEPSWNLVQFTPAQGEAMRAEILKRQEDNEDNSVRKPLAQVAGPTPRDRGNH